MRRAFEKKQEEYDFSYYEAWAQELEAQNEAAWYGPHGKTEDCNEKSLLLEQHTITLLILTMFAGTTGCAWSFSSIFL